VPPEGGTGKTLGGRDPKGTRAGLATGAHGPSWGARWAGSPLDGDARRSIDAACRRILGSRAQASASGSRWATATAGCPAVHEVQGQSLPRVPARETEPGTVVEKAL